MNDEDRAPDAAGASPTCIDQILAALAPVQANASRRRQRYTADATLYGAPSSWDAHFWAKAVDHGLHALQETIEEGGRGANGRPESPEELVDRLGQFEFPGFMEQDAPECALRSLLDYRDRLVRWLRTGMQPGRAPSLD